MPIEDEKFQREKICYEQNYAQFRSLNQIMWQVPMIAMTLTGGLWFGVANFDGMSGFQYALLLLATAANLGLIIVLTRIRFVIAGYLKKLKSFSEDGYVEAKGERWHEKSRVVVTTFRVLLLISAFISIVGIYVVYDSSRNNTEHQPKWGHHNHRQL